MTRRNALGLLSTMSLSLMLAACGSNEVKDQAANSGSASIPGLPGDAVPRPEPRSRYGNGPMYEVFGKAYTVMHSSTGYKERGVASWYGKKFHGEMTSMQEPYDMYAMTAAHKTLPLPTYVRVRNLRNGKSVVVRVNDRGPFAHNRIIDLSYTAALKLDMVRDGTSLVEVEAISFDAPSGDRPTRSTSAAPAPDRTATEPQKTVYVQVGAFGQVGNARRRMQTLRAAGIRTAFVVEDGRGGARLYRVRIGPIRDVDAYDLIVSELDKLGIADPYLVAE